MITNEEIQIEHRRLTNYTRTILTSILEERQIKRIHTLDAAEVLSNFWFSQKGKRLVVGTAYSFICRSLDEPTYWASMAFHDGMIKQKTIKRIETGTIRMSDLLRYTGYSDERAIEVMEDLSEINREIKWRKPSDELMPYTFYRCQF